MITDSYNLKALLPPAATIIWLLHSTMCSNGYAIVAVQYAAQACAIADNFISPYCILSKLMTSKVY